MEGASTDAGGGERVDKKYYSGPNTLLIKPDDTIDETAILASVLTEATAAKVVAVVVAAVPKTAAQTEWLISASKRNPAITFPYKTIPTEILPESIVDSANIADAWLDSAKYSQR